MAVKKVFTDDGGYELTAYINNNELCYIACGDLVNADSYYRGSVQLGSEDLGELIIELQYIKRQMDEKEA